MPPPNIWSKAFEPVVILMMLSLFSYTVEASSNSRGMIFLTGSGARTGFHDLEHFGLGDALDVLQMFHARQA